MKISLDWLSDFVTLTQSDPQEIARIVTERIAEVDAVEVQGVLLDGIVVGKIVKLAKHPNADKLSLADVRTDRGVLRVVCGGTNLREGMRVAFAHVGATVRWHGTEMMTLEKAKVRGEESAGMICAASELDLTAQFPASTDRTIIDLGDGDENVGTQLRDFLGLNDVVLHIDNHAITHRPDLFAHRGFARECAAAGLATWKEKAAEPDVRFPQTPFPFRITAESEKLVPRYEAAVLEIAALGDTPARMKKRLEATGWRSINLPIDITNYVMMDVGMPLHSFDAADIKGDVRMRRAKRGEKITTLDGQERELSRGALIMEDGEGIFDLLGIMGGLRGSTKDATRKVWLHAAVVDPRNTRQTVIAMGHRTDAATVYEKGVPRVAAREGLLRAIALFQELVPGARLVSAPLSWGDDGTAKPIALKMSRLQSVLGTDVPAERAASILRALDCAVEQTGKNLKVSPPLHRLGDLRGDHDLIEEVGRLIGFNDIPPVMPVAEATPPPRDRRMHALRDALKEAGFIEALPLSLVGAALLRRTGMDPEDAVAIENPLGEETRFLHPSVLPGLLEHAQRNLLLAGNVLRTFTAAHVFRKGGEEHPELGLLVTDLEGKGDTDLKRDPFLLLKRDLTDALAAAGATAGWDRDESPAPWMHPGRAATLSVDGGPAGSLFEIHPRSRRAFDLPHRAAAAILDLSLFLAKNVPARIAAPVHAFPAISYDVTTARTQEQSTANLIAKLRGASPLLENVQIVDLFSGKDLGERRFNLTLRFTYRASDRTLTEAEAQAEQEKVAKILASA